MFGTGSTRAAKSLVRLRLTVVVGDMNVVPSPADHCDGSQMTPEEFMARPARQWFRQFLAPQGPLIDITRARHPGRAKMYTCWNTLIDARPANYGTRLDYTLITPGLQKWVKDADILPHVYGSDHCPVYLDLYDHIETEAGPLALRQLLGGGSTCASPVPGMAESQQGEFSLKTQPRLHDLFGQQRAASALRASAPSLTPEAEAPPTPNADGSSMRPAPLARSQPEQASIRKPTTTDRTGARAPRLKTRSQPTLAQFFGKTPPAAQVRQAAASATKQKAPPTPAMGGAVPDDVAIEIAPALQEQRDKSAAAWSSLFTPHPPPLCTVHREPARSFTVNKAGINHGRKFWLCARPVGAGSEATKRGGPVDLQYRCDFFAWDSDVKRKRPS